MQYYTSLCVSLFDAFVSVLHCTQQSVEEIRPERESERAGLLASISNSEGWYYDCTPFFRVIFPCNPSHAESKRFGNLRNRSRLVHRSCWNAIQSQYAQLNPLHQEERGVFHEQYASLVDSRHWEKINNERESVADDGSETRAFQ